MNPQTFRPNPFIKLSTGSVRPKGWLRRELRLMADGMVGRLDELSPWCQFKGSAWASPTGEGHSPWEELPYWLKGLVSLGYGLPDKKIIAKAKRWIEAVLASQRGDGYFGPEAGREKNDLWPNMAMLNALQTFHEATGDPRVLPFMSRYFQWQFAIPPEQLLPGSWQKHRGGDNLESVFWLHQRTGEAWLLTLAQRIHERTSDWTRGIPSWHGVNICQGFREPALFYQLSHDKKHLLAAERNYQTVWRRYGQVPGGMFGADENCREGYDDPRQAAETCSMTEFMLSCEHLIRITGHPVWADRCEDVAFNSLPAAVMENWKGLRYLTAPNHPQSDKQSHAPLIENGGNMLGFDARDHRCCQHNVSHGWPYFTEHLWMATAEGGLAAVLYAPCAVRATVRGDVPIHIEEDTSYPYHDTICFTVTPAKPVKFPLWLRIPGWCRKAKVEVNGKAVSPRPSPGTFVNINRLWRPGDRVDLTLPMAVEVKSWKNNKGAISIHRGPLTYSLRIRERWAVYKKDGLWPAYEVFPTSPWNYGLVLDKKHPASSVAVRMLLTLEVNGRRLPSWNLVDGLPDLLPKSPAASREPIERLTLMPMGRARLRMSMFPQVDSS